MRRRDRGSPVRLPGRPDSARPRLYQQTVRHAIGVSRRFGSSPGFYPSIVLISRLTGWWDIGRTAPEAAPGRAAESVVHLLPESGAAVARSPHVAREGAGSGQWAAGRIGPGAPSALASARVRRAHGALQTTTEPSRILPESNTEHAEWCRRRIPYIAAGNPSQIVPWRASAHPVRDFGDPPPAQTLGVTSAAEAALRGGAASACRTMPWPSPELPDRV